MSVIEKPNLYKLYCDSLISHPAGRKDVTVQFNLLFGEHRKHATITYFGDITDEHVPVFDALFDFMDELRGQSVEFIVTGRDNFGPKHDIPVLLVDFVDPKIKDLCVTFHQRFGVPEPGFEKKLNVPSYHSSIKDESKLLDTPVGTKIIATAVSVKRLGPIDPFYSILLKY